MEDSLTNTSILSNIPLYVLLLILLVLILLSAFFSGSETGLMSLNRYRLRHLAKTDYKARIINKLLSRPDQLLSIILICNNFLNISASVIATYIGYYLLGDIGVLCATLALTFLLLIFSEITPKTLAAIKPQKFAFAAAIPLKFLLWILFPLVFVASATSNSLLRLMGIRIKDKKNDSFSIEELRIIINESSSLIPDKHKEMLASILDLEKISIESVMIPKSKIYGINLEDDIGKIKNNIMNSRYTLLPVYRHDLDKIYGILHIHNAIKLINKEEFNLKQLKSIIKKSYFIPTSTSLYQQLINFKVNKQRIGLVVNEYGELLGIITLTDLLNEIVGEFVTDFVPNNTGILHQADGSYIISGIANIRSINRNLGWELPSENSNTISGLIIEYLETIPKVNTQITIDRYKIEILVMLDNTIESVRISLLPK